MPPQWSANRPLVNRSGVSQLHFTPKSRVAQLFTWECAKSHYGIIAPTFCSSRLPRCFTSSFVLSLIHNHASLSLRFDAVPVFGVVYEESGEGARVSPTSSCSINLYARASTRRRATDQGAGDARAIDSSFCLFNLLGGRLEIAKWFLACVTRDQSCLLVPSSTRLTLSVSVVVIIACLLDEPQMFLFQTRCRAIRNVRKRVLTYRRLHD